MDHKNIDYIKSVLSFDLLVDFLKEKVQHTKSRATKALLENLLGEVDKRKELKGEIRDLTVLEKHEDVVEELMSSIFSPIDLEKEIVAIVKPYELNGVVYSTPKWAELIDVENINFSFKGIDFETFEINKRIYINSLILNEIYGTEQIYHKSLLITIPNKKNGLNKYYKIYFDKDFTKVHALKTPPKLSKDVINSLAENPYDQELWNKHIDVNNFEMHGFIIMKLMDVTQNEVLSSIKYDLLEKDSIISPEKFSQLEIKLRELYELPDLRLGIVSFAGEKNSGPKIWNSIVSEEELKAYIAEKGLSKDEAFVGCIYHNMMESGRAHAISNLEQFTSNSGSVIEQMLLEKGIKSIMVSPLNYNDGCLGGLEVASPNIDDFNNSSILLLQDILPIFSLAAKRSLEELESKLQAIIKEEFTAVHPAVEWKFVQAALNEMSQSNTEERAHRDEIVFHDVYPIYGQSDVRGSSTERNLAIQQDLSAQLQNAKDVLMMIYEKFPMGIIEEISFRIDESLESIKGGIGSGDEMTILYFLRHEIEPLLKHFRESGTLSIEPYQYYFSQLDSELGILYRKRKEFEESLTRINDKVAHLLEEQQSIIQKSYPHYFEKYKTDGVEYNIYMGQSITPDKPFDMVYLNDLRLWQLKTTALIAQMTDALKCELPLPLETTHLILVNSTPISIRFREDEKQFDVDGAYNIRYEIIKKRIDKAHIKNTNERITQPGKIAIVYTQEKEAEEYRRYLQFLQNQGLIEDEIENHQLEELQGVNGLKALRVKVKLPKFSEKKKKKDFPEEIIENIFHTEKSE